MKKIKLYKTIVFMCMFFVSSILHATLITFDTAISGATSFSFDGDGDSIDDVIFTTTDGFGFNTVGPGTNMSYISEPGLEGTTTLSPDLRVDFLNNAITNLGFGLALNSLSGGSDGVLFSVFDGSDNLLNSVFQSADFTLPDGTNQSDFPEALVSLDFTGFASYATFDFSQNTSSRYIIDDFSGTFGSTDNIVPKPPTPVPEPSILSLVGIGLVGLGLRRRKARLG